MFAQRNAAHGGYSLAEIMVVMTILAVLAGAAAPIFSRTIAESRESRAVEGLVESMQFARARAIAASVEHRVYLDPDSGRYHVARVDGDTTTRLEPRGLARPPVRLPASLRFLKPQARRDDESGAYYVGFYASGASDASRVRIAREGLRWERIEIRTTGTRVSVEYPDE